MSWTRPLHRAQLPLVGRAEEALPNAAQESLRILVEAEHGNPREAGRPRAPFAGKPAKGTNTAGHTDCAGRATAEIRRRFPLVNSRETGQIRLRPTPPTRREPTEGEHSMAKTRAVPASRRARPAVRPLTRRVASKSGSTKAAPTPVSPLAPKSLAALPPLAGVRLATIAAGIRYRDRDDVLLAVLAPGTQAAGVFTRSKTASASVEWCRANPGKADSPRARRQ